MCTVASKLINFGKGVCIDEHLNTFAGCLLALGMLLLYRTGRTCVDGFIDSSAEVFNLARGGM
jgi:hypothetical protein